MPFATHTSVRSAITQSISSDVSVPPYAVLFFYNTTSYWSSLSNGVLGQGYYRIAAELTPGSKPYFIQCIADGGSDWTQTTGAITDASVSISDNDGTLFDVGGTHDPMATGFRTYIPQAFAYKTGDTASTVGKYYPQTSPHPGHFHSTKRSEEHTSELQSH